MCKDSIHLCCCIFHYKNSVSAQLSQHCCLNNSVSTLLSQQLCLSNFVSALLSQCSVSATLSITALLCIKQLLKLPSHYCAFLSHSTTKKYALRGPLASSQRTTTKTYSHCCVLRFHIQQQKTILTLLCASLTYAILRCCVLFALHPHCCVYYIQPSRRILLTFAAVSFSFHSIHKNWTFMLHCVFPSFSFALSYASLPLHCCKRNLFFPLLSCCCASLLHFISVPSLLCIKASFI